MLQNIPVSDCEALVLFVSIAEQNGAKQHLKKWQLEPRGDQHSWFHHFKFRKHHLKPKKETGIWGKFQCFQNKHISDGELDTEHAYDAMGSGHTLYRGASLKDRSVSQHPQTTQGPAVQQDWPPDGGNHVDEGPKDKWTRTRSWHSGISSLIINALQDQEVMPLLIHTVLGLSTRKSVGKCPFSVLFAQWEDAIIALEKPRAQNREDRRFLPYLSSESTELIVSKPLGDHSHSSPGLLLVHDRKVLVMPCCCCRTQRKSPIGTSYVPISNFKFCRCFENSKSKI